MGYVGKVKDTAGTTHLVGSTLYGTCATAAATAAKVVTLSDFSELVTGVTIHVKFTYSNTASNATLNVNSTGAKPLCSHGTTRVGTTEKTSWNAGAVVSLTYDGTSWVMNDYIPDTGVTTDTKNTAGAIQSAAKLYLVGAPSQSANPVTNSHVGVYMEDGSLHADNFNGIGITEGTNGIIIGNGSYGIEIPDNYVLGTACQYDQLIDFDGATIDHQTVPSSKAVADYVAKQVAGLLNYAGTRSAASGAITEGDYWIASAAFTIPVPSGGTGDPITVEPGDMIIVKTTGTSMTTANVDVVQTNIDTLTTTEIDSLWAAA